MVDIPLDIFTAINFVNCDSENEEDSEDFESDCPDHYFWVKNEHIKSGKRKGESKWLVSLVIPPDIFKRMKDRKMATHILAVIPVLKLVIICSYATAQKSENGDSSPSFELRSWCNQHECSPSSTNHLGKKFLDHMYNVVKKFLD